MTSRAFALVGIAILWAGCVGQEPVSNQATMDAPPSVSRVDAQVAVVVEPQQRNVTVSYSGDTGTAFGLAFVGMSAGPVRTQMMEGQDNASYLVDEIARPSFIHARLAWDAASEETRELTFALGGSYRNGSATYFVEVVRVSGPSPLVLDSAVEDWEDHWAPTLDVGVHSPSSAVLLNHGRQPFEVAGSLAGSPARG